MVEISPIATAGWLVYIICFFITIIYYRGQRDIEKLSRIDVAKYQLMRKEDVEVILCLAEFFQPGMLS